MSATLSLLNHRGFLASSAAVAASGLFATSAQPAVENGSIRPFRVYIPEDQLIDLRCRIAATRWPEREMVSDESHGVQLPTMHELARYWETDEKVMMLILFRRL
jgi:Epoxide hydrolase N terminus